MAVIEIALEDLKIHPKNIRTEYEGIDELAQSIRENGIMQNLTVVPDPEETGKYLVVIGNRRLTAARQAGITSAPCVINDMSEKEQITTMLTENMNRKDLKIYEEAAGIQMCFADYGLTIDELEEKTGLSKSTIHHRLNVAKLNPKVLKRKSDDVDFQLTLKDLYALEQIKSVRTRNRILKEAYSSADLANRARRAAADELEQANEKELISLCEQRGIKPAPKRAGDELYSSRWDSIITYNLSQKPPKQLKISKKETGLFYLTRYRSFYIIKKAVDEKQKKEPSPQEKKAKETEKNRKEIKAICKAMFADMGDFVRSIFDGKAGTVTDTEKLIRMIWDVLIYDNAYISRSNIFCVVTGLNLWETGSLSEDERKAAHDKADNLPVIHQQLAVAYWYVKDMNLTEYDGTYAEHSGRKTMMFYDILAMFGYTWPDADMEKVANGKHELYKKK